MTRRQQRRRRTERNRFKRATKRHLRDANGNFAKAIQKLYPRHSFAATPWTTDATKLVAHAHPFHGRTALLEATE